MFKICVVGCGEMSNLGHGPSYKKYSEDHDGVCLAACCDLDADRAEQYRSRFGFERAYTDYAEMIDWEKPDAVALISPVALTKELAVSIMKKGCNIILEKPPGVASHETLEMMEQAKNAGVFVRTAFNRRYTPLVLKLKEMTAGKRIFNITYQMYRSGRKDRNFYTTAIHAVDAVKDIVGAPYRKVNISYQELPDIGDGVANFYLDCEFENGVRGDITVVPVGGVAIERITVNTLGETYFADLPAWNNLDTPGKITVIEKGKITAEISGDELTDGGGLFEDMGFYEENRSFFELIRSGSPVSCDLESGIQSLEIAECMEKRISVYEK